MYTFFQIFNYLFPYFMCMHMCLHKFICIIHWQIPLYTLPEEDDRVPGTAVKGGLELPNVGARNQHQTV